MSSESPVAHVHGRFQPFHDEHLAYVRWAAREHSGDRLVVGITNADAAHTAREDADPDRHRPENNPFTYYERQRMIREALDDAALNCAIDITPFPINRPELWDAYAPPWAIHYVNVLEAWHEHKIETLREHGRAVRYKRGTRTVSGTEIRRAMAKREPWASHVPDPIVTYIEAHDLRERVERLYPDTE
ncbi:MAG: nicotinate-nucleotide adenylyltransferase [Halobacteriota archaeon]